MQRLLIKGEFVIFSEAFKYPYNNLPRVLMITLAFAMITAVFFALMLNSLSNSSIIILSLIVGIPQALFLSGYGIRMLRAIIYGDENAPPVKVMEDIGQGVRVAIASIAYFLPALLIFLVIVLLGGGSGSSRTANAGLSLVMLCGVLLMIPLVFLLGWALQIGMCRYAIEGSGLFEYGTNIRIARQNIGPAFSLSARYLLLGIVYGILTAVVNSIYQSIVNLMITFRTAQSIIVMLLTIGTIFSTTLSIMSQFSGLHLLAQFSMMIGLGPEKPKPIDPDMYTSSDY